MTEPTGPGPVRLTPLPSGLLSGPRSLLAFLRGLLASFFANNGPQNAASLAYTTLLSLVPLMTILVGLLAAFPVSRSFSDPIQDFIFDNLIPDFGNIVQEYVRQFSERAAGLSGVGAIVLLLVAVLLMANIDRAFGMIWKVRRRRSVLGKFMVYWSILSLGPVLMGLSVATTSYLLSLPVFGTGPEGPGGGLHLIGFAPLLASTAAFTLLYLLVPNRRIPLGHALTGGLAASLLFEAAKRAFGLYLIHFPTHQAIYGALATVPIFLIWLYISWTITLLGGELVHRLGTGSGGGAGAERDPGSDFLLALDLLGDLWAAQRNGLTLSTRRLARRHAALGEEWIEALLGGLQKARWVLRSEDGHWALARDLAQLCVYDLFRAGPFVLPRPGAEPARCAGDRLPALLAALEQDLRRILDLPLAELYRHAQAGAGGGSAHAAGEQAPEGAPR